MCNQSLEQELSECHRKLEAARKLLGAKEKKLRKLSELLASSHDRFNGIVEKHNDGIMIIDQEGKIRFANKAAKTLFIYKEKKLLGARFNFPLNTGRSVEIGVTRRNGEPGIAQIHIIKTKWKKKNAYLAAVYDITERKQMDKQLKEMALFDTLTGLPNRKLFFNSLDKSLALAKRNESAFALLFLDLDGFKKINDTFGHDAGDLLLVEVANRLRNCIRMSDMVARMGGDEFIIILSLITGEQDASRVARKIIKSLNRPLKLEGYECSVGASIGISLFPNDGDDANTLVGNADVAMYNAKKFGRNDFQFHSPEMKIKALERLTLENNLRRAYEKKEFVLHYQPQVDINTGEIIGVEALIRWRHQEQGLLYPAKFIYIAEETGLINTIDEWVLRTACAQNRAWRDMGLPPLRMAVNMSGLKFSRPEQMDLILKIIKEEGLSPGYLEVELTETVIMRNLKVTATAMYNLDKSGIPFAVDDFGTGYSSLNYLKRLPIHRLKIDISFIRDITRDKDDVAIVTAIITMAHSLNLRVIAEGVETDKQLQLLRRLNCDEIQGFLISKPVPADQFVKLYASRLKSRAKSHPSFQI